jgi:hypothetical protein
MRRALIAVLLPAAVAIIPGALFGGIGIALYMRLRERNRVQVLAPHTTIVGTPRVTLLSFAPRRRPWVRA